MPIVSIHMPDDLKEDLDSHLEYGDSRSEFIAEAVEKRLQEQSEDDNEA